MINSARNPHYFNNLSKGHFPEHLGIKITHVEAGKMEGEMPIKKEFFAPNGYLHAGSIISFADTLAGYASVAHLPENAKTFTTIELKSNFTGAIKQGMLIGECIAEHLGRTTHVWRVIVKDEATDKKIAIFSARR